MKQKQSGNDDYELRQARPSDTRDIAELWCEAFPGSRTVEDRMVMLQTGGRYGGLETVLVLRDAEGALLGAAKLYRMEGHVAGAAFPLMGLAAVAIASAHRRRGLGERLCRAAIRVAAERGDVASALYPFRPEYYRRLGWGQVGALHDHRFHTEALPEYPESRHVRTATPDDTDAIAACYARVVIRSNGPITRDDRIWAYRLAAEELGVRPLSRAEGGAAPAVDPKLRAVVFDEEGVSGYALLRHATPASGRRILVVRELVAETERAYRGLLGHVAAQRDRWPVARHFARPEERFGDRLSDPRPPGHGTARSLYFPTARIIRGPMLRILDVPAALRLRPWFDAEPTGAVEAGLRITVTDPQLPSNEGPWTVRLHGKGARATVEAAGEGALGGAEPDGSLTADAATFARIFVGEVSPGDAARLGSAEITGDGDLLDRAFATRERFWLLDEF